MQIEFSNHSLDQLKVRSRITKQMVIDAVSDPDKALESYRDRKLYQKAFETDTLEVVTRQEDNTIIIITEYILEQES
jgi:Domain of unknown function (DUF4258)